MESSILPYGSNDATAEISNNESKEEQLDNDTQIEIKDEQSDDTQTTEMLKQLLNKF